MTGESDRPAPIGIIAGGGDLPARLVEACQAKGHPVFILALKGFARPEVVSRHPHAWIRLGEAGRGMALLRDHGIRDLVMIGPVRRPSLADLRPDLTTARFFARIGLRALGDDGLLRAVIGLLEDEGFTVHGVHHFLEDVLAPLGQWGHIGPDEQARSDIAHGVTLAQALGRLDVGQAVVVQQGWVLGVDAIEGTDALLARCATLARQGPGGVLVTMRKPQQEQRADLPTIGLHTVEAAHAAGLRGVAVQAGGTLVVDRAAVIQRADALGLFLLGVEGIEP